MIFEKLKKIFTAPKQQPLITVLLKIKLKKSIIKKEPNLLLKWYIKKLLKERMCINSKNIHKYKKNFTLKNENKKTDKTNKGARIIFLPVLGFTGVVLDFFFLTKNISIQSDDLFSNSVCIFKKY